MLSIQGAMVRKRKAQALSARSVSQRDSVPNLGDGAERPLSAMARSARQRRSRAD
ncbi:MAG: hypothetical protein KME57_16980 [Scytonema hyalinum WJT4-NPBG1]|nr:hypothetical protein [Scytonema hyalinum WJT4-NPBG1]